ncbi:recombinase family protein [Streptomyces prasinus]
MRPTVDRKEFFAKSRSRRTLCGSGAREVALLIRRPIAERGEPRKALDRLREGDTLVVPSPDRLGRSIQDLIALVSGLRKRGLGLTSLHEALDTTTPGGRLEFHVFAALAEFIRELLVQGANEGLDAAPARGARLGRPPAMTEEKIRHARDLLTRPENTARRTPSPRSPGSSASPATRSTSTHPNRKAAGPRSASRTARRLCPAPHSRRSDRRLPLNSVPILQAPPIASDANSRQVENLPEEWSNHAVDLRT